MDFINRVIIIIRNGSPFVDKVVNQFEERKTISWGLNLEAVERWFNKPDKVNEKFTLIKGNIFSTKIDGAVCGDNSAIEADPILLRTANSFDVGRFFDTRGLDANKVEINTYILRSGLVQNLGLLFNSISFIQPKNGHIPFIYTSFITLNQNPVDTNIQVSSEEGFRENIFNRLVKERDPFHVNHSQGHIHEFFPDKGRIIRFFKINGLVDNKDLVKELR